MTKELNERFQEYKKSEFLIVSSLLDPRFTTKIEATFKKPFNYFLPMIMRFAQNLSKDVALENNEDTQHAVVDNLQTPTISEEVDFWQIAQPDLTPILQRQNDWKYSFEVILLQLQFQNNF